METPDKKSFKDRNFELRSEKVRNVVGQIPPTLIRYGTLVIALAIATMIGISAFIPYRKVITGTATVYNIPVLVDSVLTLCVELRMPIGESNINPIGCTIVLMAPKSQFTGQLTGYNPLRTVEGKNKAEITFLNQDMEYLQNTETDFILTVSEKALLKKFFDH